jgi:hypothetical protein
MVGTRNAHRNLEKKFLVKKSPCQTRRWDINIQVDLKDIGHEDLR